MRPSASVLNSTRSSWSSTSSIEFSTPSRTGAAAASGLNWISRLPGTDDSGEMLACILIAPPSERTNRSTPSASDASSPPAIAISVAKRA